MTSKQIQLVPKSSWDVETFGEPIVIDTCRKRLALVASLHVVALWNCVSGKVEQHIRFTEKITSASFHPSGHHILIGFGDKLRLANVLVDVIETFFEAKTRICVDCKFNKRGHLFAAISGLSIEVYDFIHGSKITTIECRGSYRNLQWGNNCMVHAISDDRSLLCRWDALTGDKIGEFSNANGQILDSIVTNEGNAILSSSSNSIMVLNSELICTSEIKIEDEFELLGPIAVSDEGLIFASILRKESQSPVVRIYSLIGEDQFDHNFSSSALNVIRVSHDSKFLITNNTLFAVRDRRGYNQSIITAYDQQEEDVVSEECKEMFVTSSYIESQSTLLHDVQSRLSDLEALFELELKTVQNDHEAEMKTLREHNDNELSGKKKKLVALQDEKDAVSQQCQQLLQEARESHAKELEQCALRNKDELLRQVKIHFETEQAWEKETLANEAKKQQAFSRQQQEINKFRSEVTEKLSRQRHVTAKLQNEKAGLEQENKEAIAQLEEEIEILVYNTEKEISRSSAEERGISEQLMLETGILKRRLTHTRKTIDDARERVAVMLDRTAGAQTKMNQKQVALEKLEKQLLTKESEIVSKDAAVDRLSSINSNLLKARSIELDRITEARSELDEVKEKIVQVEKEIARKYAVLEEQRRENESVTQRIAELRDMVLAEDVKKLALGSQIRKQESRINHYLNALHSLKNNIQEHAELRRILSRLFEESRAWSAVLQESNVSNDVTGSNEKWSSAKMVEMMNELDQLKAEEAIVTLKHKEERQKQVKQNAKLLELISTKKETTKLSSGHVSSGILVKNNMKRIQALGDARLS